jgi:uncharacterized protein (DUF427 family)
MRIVIVSYSVIQSSLESKGEQLPVHYSPPGTICREFFWECNTHAVCAWKGVQIEK